jgi:putative transposase
MQKRKHIRLKDFDYTIGEYFVTICTDNRKCYFGEIKDGKMQLSAIGLYLEDQIEKTFILRESEVEIPYYVIMPNHVHLIVFINSCKDNHIENCTDALGASLQFGSQRGNLASVIRGLKSTVTHFAIENKIDFKWQPRYHEHIIRNYIEMNHLADYIDQNVYNWSSDEYNE